MKIETLQELSKLIDMCNKKGVGAITVDNLTVTLTGQPRESKRSKEDAALSDETALDWNDLTPEEQMFYSTGGMPMEVRKPE